MDQYLDHLETVRPHLPPQVRYLAVDGAYAFIELCQWGSGLPVGRDQ